MTDNTHDLTQKFEDLSLSWMPHAKPTAFSAKEKYIQEKINPTDEKERDKLEKKLDLTYSDKQFNLKLENEKVPSGFSIQKSNRGAIKKLKNLPMAITRESKLAEYKKQLEANFDERETLEKSEKEVIESYTNKYFKPLVAVKGYLETEHARKAREEMGNMVARAQFIKDNKEQALLYALRKEIRNDLKQSTDKIEKLNKEEKAQSLLENPGYKKRVGGYFHNTPKIKAQDKHKATEVLSIALKAKLETGLQPKELFTQDALKKIKTERTVIFSQFKSELASAKNKVSVEMAIESGVKTKFKAF